MPYPRLKETYSKSELHEFFQITNDELQFINEARPKKDKNFLKATLLWENPAMKNNVRDWLIVDQNTKELLRLSSFDMKNGIIDITGDVI